MRNKIAFALLMTVFATCNIFSQEFSKVYYIEKDGKLATINGDPYSITSNPDYWAIRLFRKGEPKTGSRPWGLMTGKTLDEVISRLKKEQGFEKKYPWDWGVLTYNNFLGPIACFKSNSKTKQNVEENLEKAKENWDKIDELRQTYRDVKDLTSADEDVANRDRKMGETLKDFMEIFGKAYIKSFSIAKNLFNLNTTNLSSLNNELKSFDLDLSRAQKLNVTAKEFVLSNSNSTGNFNHQSYKYSPTMSIGTSFDNQEQIDFEIKKQIFYFKHVTNSKIYDGNSTLQSQKTETKTVETPVSNLAFVSEKPNDKYVNDNKYGVLYRVVISFKDKVTAKIINSQYGESQEQQEYLDLFFSIETDAVNAISYLKRYIK